MHFIIPKNYKIKSKLLGLIDYQTAILDGIWAILLYAFVNLLFDNISVKFYIFIGGFIPVFLISIIGLQNESIISVFCYLFKYFRNQKVYLYKKSNF